MVQATKRVPFFSQGQPLSSMGLLNPPERAFRAFQAWCRRPSSSPRRSKGSPRVWMPLAEKGEVEVEAATMKAQQAELGHGLKRTSVNLFGPRNLYGIRWHSRKPYSLTPPNKNKEETAWTFKLRQISGCFRRPLRFTEFQSFSTFGAKTHTICVVSSRALAIESKCTSQHWPTCQ